MTKYVLIKRDLFECPKHMGYTGIRDKAGVYDEDHVKGYEVPIREAYDCQEEDLYALPFDAAPEFTRDCYSDLARDHLMAKIAVLRKELAGAVEALGIVKEQRVKLREENLRLRQVIHECADELANGSFISPDASIEFMEKLPGEIRAVIWREAA